MIINFTNDTTSKIPKDLFTSSAEIIAKGEKILPDQIVDLIVVDNSRIHELNKKYLNRDYPTDVLAFPFKKNNSFIVAPTARPLLGQIVISYAKTEEQAGKEGHSVEREFAFLFIHGLLHLLGYDHEQGGSEQEKMNQKQDYYINKITNL